MKKGWKTVTTAVLALVLGLAVAAPALAAKVPVYINGFNDPDGEYRLLTYAVERGGYTYVPLRVVFEECGAEVEWTAADQSIAARFRGRTVLMQVGSKQVRVAQAEGDDWRRPTAGEVELALEAAPYLQGGTVYVPLRFTAESVGCGVQYDGAERSVRLKKGCLMDCINGGALYRLDEYSGRLTRVSGDSERELGLVDRSCWPNWRPAGMVVTDIGNENYLVQIDASESGAITVGGRYCCWLNAANKTCCAVFDSRFLLKDCQAEPCWLEYADGGRELCLAGNRRYLPGDEVGETVFIDLAAGEVKQRFAGGDFLWTDGRWLLQGWGARWELIDRRDGSRRDLAPILLSEENKTKMDDMVRPHLNYLGPNDFDERVRQLFWGNIDNDMTIEPRANIAFLGEENGILRFELQAVFMEVVGQKDEDYVIPVDIAI